MHDPVIRPAAPKETIAFDFTAMPPRDRYKLLIGAVVPRPIALVTTISKEGIANAAPYSFFNCLSPDPAILALGVEFRPSGAHKDTGRNIRDTLCFTVNIVSDAIAEAMSACAVAFPPGVDELVEAGLTAMPGTRIAAPRIAEAPIAFECRHHTTLMMGHSREIILGEVLEAHVRADLVDPARLHIDPARLDAVGRMGGHGYCSTRDYFDMPTVPLEQWRQGERPQRTRAERDDR